MSEAPKPPESPVATLPAAETNGQLIGALAIIATMAIMGIALVVAGVMTGKWDVLAGGIGTVIGALGTALNAPSGIGSVIRANSASKPPTDGAS